MYELIFRKISDFLCKVRRLPLFGYDYFRDSIRKTWEPQDELSLPQRQENW